MFCVFTHLLCDLRHCDTKKKQIPQFFRKDVVVPYIVGEIYSTILPKLCTVCHHLNDLK